MWEKDRGGGEVGGEGEGVTGEKKGWDGREQMESEEKRK